MCAVKDPKGIFDNTPAASTKFIIHNAEKNDVTFKKTNFVVNKTEYNMGSKKDKVIEELYKICKRRNNYVFHNDLVKDICRKVGFGNPFDVTKLDNKTKLPEILKIFGVYVVKTIENKVTNLKLLAYTFENPFDEIFLN